MDVRPDRATAVVPAFPNDDLSLRSLMATLCARSFLSTSPLPTGRRAPRRQKRCCGSGISRCKNSCRFCTLSTISASPTMPSSRCRSIEVTTSLASPSSLPMDAHLQSGSARPFERNSNTQIDTPARLCFFVPHLLKLFRTLNSLMPLKTPRTWTSSKVPREVRCTRTGSQNHDRIARVSYQFLGVASSYHRSSDFLRYHSKDWCFICAVTRAI
jgi:hypothetical protein